MASAESKTCQCDSSGYCQTLKRYMSPVRYAECKKKPGYYETFLAESKDGRYDAPKYQKKPTSKPKLVNPTVPMRVKVGIGRKLKNLTAALRQARANKSIAIDSIRNAREEICLDCEFRDGNTCSGCGCNLALKQLMDAWVCPYAKWPGDIKWYGDLLDSSVDNWAVGLTTCPRPKATVAKTLESINRAGWPYLEVFNDESKQIGAWNNFRRGLANLIAHQPEADAYLMFQDDLIVSANAKKYLEQTLWPASIWPASSLPKIGIISLYCYPGNHKETAGYHNVTKESAFGALGYVFTPLSARLFIRDTKQLTRSAAQIDLKVWNWCRQQNLIYYSHSPSLIQHTGETSTISNLSMNSRRMAKDFAEDALELLSHDK